MCIAGVKVHWAPVSPQRVSESLTVRVTDVKSERVKSERSYLSVYSPRTICEVDITFFFLFGCHVYLFGLYRESVPNGWADGRTEGRIASTLATVMPGHLWLRQSHNRQMTLLTSFPSCHTLKIPRQETWVPDPMLFYCLSCVLKRHWVSISWKLGQLPNR